jgi:hypothetical protein
MRVEKWIAFWRNHEGSGYHTKDRDAINAWRYPQNGKIDIPTTPSFPLDRKDRGKLHPRLTPVPYVGDIRNAKIILAMLNPTVDCNDYVDNEKPEFHELLRWNRQQENVQSCFAVDETLQAPSWSRYYRSLFRSAVKCATDASKAHEEKVWETLCNSLAIMELVPYYSQNASMLLQNDRYADLPSAKCALEAMEEVRERCDTIVICRWGRGPERWRMPPGTYICSATRRGLSAAAKKAVCEQLVKLL